MNVADDPELLSFTFSNQSELPVTGSVRLETKGGQTLYDWNGTLAPRDYVYPGIEHYDGVLLVWAYEDGQPCTGQNVPSPKELDFSTGLSWKLFFQGNGTCGALRLSGS